MKPSHFAAVLIAANLAVAAAGADEYTTFHHLEVSSSALQPCRGGMLLNLPPSWRAGDGVAVLVTVGQPRDAMRDILVSVLLSEHAAVVELVPARCDAVQDSIVVGAIDALDAMARTMGAGMAVAIGFGSGSAAMLEVVRAPAMNLLGADGPRYAAAVAIGDGAPAFALGESLPTQERTPSRLATLCRALAAVFGGMGVTPERAVPAAAAETCLATLADETAVRATVAAARR